MFRLRFSEKKWLNYDLCHKSYINTTSRLWLGQVSIDVCKKISVLYRHKYYIYHGMGTYNDN